MTQLNNYFKIHKNTSLTLVSQFISEIRAPDKPHNMCYKAFPAIGKLIPRRKHIIKKPRKRVVYGAILYGAIRGTQSRNLLIT